MSFTPMLTEESQVQDFLRKFIIGRIKECAGSINLLQYAAGMVHALDMMTVPDSPAEKEARAAKYIISSLITRLQKRDAATYVDMLEEAEKLRHPQTPEEKIEGGENETN